MADTLGTQRIEQTKREPIDFERCAAATLESGEGFYDAHCAEEDSNLRIYQNHKRMTLDSQHLLMPHDQLRG